MIQCGRGVGCLLTMVMLVGLFAVPSAAAVPEEPSPGRKMAIQATKAKPLVRTITADHSKFIELQFTDEQLQTMKPEEVTKACLKCHNQAALQFHQTIHWSWRDKDENGKQTSFGKGGISVNNF